jgi:hypothetical protein
VRSCGRRDWIRMGAFGLALCSERPDGKFGQSEFAATPARQHGPFISARLWFGLNPCAAERSVRHAEFVLVRKC